MYLLVAGDIFEQNCKLFIDIKWQQIQVIIQPEHPENWSFSAQGIDGVSRKQGYLPPNHHYNEFIKN